MAARVVLSDDAWAAIRLAYETTDEAVEAIGLRFGVSKDRIYTQMRREHWPRRSQRKGQRVADVPPPVVWPVPAKPEMAGVPQAAEYIPAVPLDEERPAETHAQRLERLHRIIDRLLMKLERTMANTPNMTPQDQEKTARAVTQTVTAMERVTELANTQGKVPETDGGQSHDRAEADRMRREIAERLERLSAKFSDGPAQPE
ncbi:MAG: hypothetical protein B7Y80_06045 [Hyphomicrobium sp. 32-62-53]|nr:MAG: hypothetical protein B7Z29_11775 [Hyphomicrobium sp. 12-62-95]OYY00786.1 MAG: hypothetical protein B7Y80_06045 [Hyphomicrobium sp. 32-62-53]